MMRDPYIHAEKTLLPGFGHQVIQALLTDALGVTPDLPKTVRTGGPATYSEAAEMPLTDVLNRYPALNDRDSMARAIAALQARGEWNDDRSLNPEDYPPLTAGEHLELLALGEALARYYRHPVQVHHAVMAGVTWEQIAAGADTSYDSGSKEDRRPGGGYDSDAAMLEAVSEAEHDLAGHAREVSQVQEQAAAAMDAAQAALEAAYAMPVKDECDGCHGFREAAIADAQGRIGTCEAAASILDPLAARLAAALEKLRQVPQDLGEAYELVYSFIRKGGRLPECSRWIEGGVRA